jgi:hypothetical protein
MNKFLLTVFWFYVIVFFVVLCGVYYHACILVALNGLHVAE